MKPTSTNRTVGQSMQSMMTKTSTVPAATVNKLDPNGLDCLLRAYGDMPVEMLEVRRGRNVAVYQKTREDCDNYVFLIHGSCASMTQWLYQLDFLERFYNVVAFDFFGCGRSLKPKDFSKYATKELVQDIAMLIRHISGHSDGRKVAVAHSIGCSFLLQALAVEDDITLDAVVLLGASGERPTIGDSCLFRAPMCVLDMMQTTMTKRFESAAFTQNTLSDDAMETKDMVSLSHAVSNSNPMYMCQAFYRQVQMPDDNQLSKVNVPVLFIHGKEDGIVDPDSSVRLRDKLVNCKPSKYISIDNASHQLMQEQPTEVNRAILNFLVELKLWHSKKG